MSWNSVPLTNEYVGGENDFELLSNRSSACGQIFKITILALVVITTGIYMTPLFYHPISLTPPVRVGVLVNANGDLANFTFSLVDSGRKYLLTNQLLQNVTYVIFTNRPEEVPIGSDVITVYQRQVESSPDALWRCFAYLNTSSLLLQTFDYLIALDADMVFVSRIGTEILADLFGTLHQGYWQIGSRDDLPYESRPQSCAYVPNHKRRYYFVDIVFGGLTANVIDLCQITAACVIKDLRNGLVPIKHDESTLNKYFSDRPPTSILSPAYCAFDGYDLADKPKIMTMKKLPESSLSGSAILPLYK